MAKSTREREQALEHLLELTPECKWSKCTGKHGNDSNTQLDTVEEANSEVREASSFAQAVCAQKEDEVSWRQVQVDVF